MASKNRFRTKTHQTAKKLSATVSKTGKVCANADHDVWRGCEPDGTTGKRDCRLGRLQHQTRVHPSSEATSRSVRAWFLAYDFTVRKFNKMPGHHAYDLTVKPTGATRIQDEAEAFRRIAEALESAGLKFARDELALTRAGNLVRICFLGRLADVPESAGWFDVPNPETQTRL